MEGTGTYAFFEQPFPVLSHQSSPARGINRETQMDFAWKEEHNPPSVCLLRRWPPLDKILRHMTGTPHNRVSYRIPVSRFSAEVVIRSSQVLEMAKRVFFHAATDGIFSRCFSMATPMRAALHGPHANCYDDH